MRIPFLFAFDPSDVMAMFIPIIALMIPIVVVLSKHQQKMAEIIHGSLQSNDNGELRREVADLRNLVQRQALAIDQISRQQLEQKSAASDLSVRLGSEQ